MQPQALGCKASDEFAVPLCCSHHRAVHRVGDERAWWQTAGVDPLKAARRLWRHTRVNEGRIRLERTIGAIDSDILSTMGEKTPEYRVGQVFHMTGLDIKKSIIRCLDV